MRIVTGVYFVISLILISGFYLPGGISETTPTYIVWHGNLVFYVLLYLTMALFVELIGYLFSPPLHERVYQVFPHSNLAPLLMGVFYLFIAYGLWKKNGLAWTVAFFATALSVLSDLLLFLPMPWGMLAWLGLFFNFFVVYQLTRLEVRELCGNPLKKLKDAILSRQH